MTCIHTRQKQTLQSEKWTVRRCTAYKEREDWFYSCSPIQTNKWADQWMWGKQHTNNVTCLVQMDNACVGTVHILDFSHWRIIGPCSWPRLSEVIAAGRRLTLWHTSRGPLVPSRPPSLTNAITQTHAKQAAVATAPHIQLQMSALWVPALFDAMNNGGGFSFKRLAEKCNTWLFWSLTCSSQSVSKSSYTPTCTALRVIFYLYVIGWSCRKKESSMSSGDRGDEMCDQ